MFIVFNRAKINSYLISIGTVITLFSMTFIINKNFDTVETAISAEEENDNEIDDKFLLTNNLKNNINIVFDDIENGESFVN